MHQIWQDCCIGACFQQDPRVNGMDLWGVSSPKKAMGDVQSEVTSPSDSSVVTPWGAGGILAWLQRWHILGSWNTWLSWPDWLMTWRGDPGWQKIAVLLWGAAVEGQGGAARDMGNWSGHDQHYPGKGQRSPSDGGN
ncbi:hypothetical protein BKA82DRAFT_4016414 [Pisolithus tinctorius]|nr:hypothetical protein BKA82DRAFT_4016414 [Pisolithus tinctorius]